VTPTQLCNNAFRSKDFSTREGSQIEISKIILIWDGNSIPLDFLLANLNFGAVFWRENPNLLDNKKGC